MNAKEYCFESPYDVAETQRRLAAFFNAQAANPAAEFSGTVEDGWVRIRRTGLNLFGFEYRGEVVVTNGGCLVELLITPTPLTFVALLLVAITGFVGCAFAIMLAFGWGFYEGSAFARGLQWLLVLIVGGLITLALLGPRKLRRNVISELRKAAVAR